MRVVFGVASISWECHNQSITASKAGLRLGVGVSGSEDLSPLLKQRVFEAVQAELLESGLDRFRIEGVAQRAGVEPNVIQAQWHDRRVLLMETMLARTTGNAWNPDTGSLHTDLEVIRDLAVQLSQSSSDRALFRRVLPNRDDVDLAEISSDLWAARFNDAAQILERAAKRAQLRDGVVPLEAIRMFAAAFYYDVIFADAPVRPEYAEQVIDIFLHGILGAGGRDRPWLEVERFLQRHADGENAAGGDAADRAVETARRAVTLMRAWADSMHDPVNLLEAVRDGEGRVVDFICRDLNRAACEQMGLRRAELVGQSLVEMLPSVESSGLLKHYVHCLETGDPLVLNDFPFHFYDMETRLDIRVTCAGAELVTATWRDVTDRYESAQRDKRYRQLMDFSTVPAALATPDGRFVSVNQAMADFVGSDIDTMLTMRWQDLVPPQHLPEQLQDVSAMLNGGTDSYRGIKQYLRPDGRRVWGDLSVSCIRSDDGTLEHFIAQVIDVTALVDSRREIAKQEDRVPANRQQSGVGSAAKMLVASLPVAIGTSLRAAARTLSTRGRRR